MRGPIESRWERVGGKIRLHVQIPIGATALVSIPAASASGISEQGKLVADIEEVKVVESSGNGTVLEVPSGTYRFEVGNDKGGQIAIGR